MTGNTPVSLPVWEKMVTDYGDPFAPPPGAAHPPVARPALPPVPARRPLAGRGATALSALEAS